MPSKLFRKMSLAGFQVTRETTHLAIALAGIAFADMLMFILSQSLVDGETAALRAFRAWVREQQNRSSSLLLSA